MNTERKSKWRRKLWRQQATGSVLSEAFAVFAVGTSYFLGDRSLGSIVYSTYASAALAKELGKSARTTFTVINSKGESVYPDEQWAMTILTLVVGPKMCKDHLMILKATLFRLYQNGKRRTVVQFNE